MNQLPADSKKADKNSLRMFVASLLFGAIGLLVVGGGLYSWWRGHASESWPKVPGVVVRSTFQSVPWRDKVHRHTDIRYEYRWHELTWEGRYVRLDERTVVDGESPRMKEDLAAYPVGKKVEVAVDPQKYDGAEDAAVLEPGVVWSPIWIERLIPGTVLLIVSAGAGWMAWREGKKAAQAG